MTQPLTTIGAVLDDENLLGQHFKGASWDNWKALLRGAFAEPLSPAQRGVFENLAGGRAPPEQRVKELWVIAGRRSGKSSIAAAIACYLASFVNYKPHLRAGERALICCLAVNRSQAGVCLGYIRGMLTGNRLLRGMIEGETAEYIGLSTGCDITVQTASFRGSRGRTLAAAILDEASFWRSELTVNPDLETYRVLVPSLATLSGISMIIGLGSAYRRAGLMFAKYKQFYGQPGAVLVIKAETRQLNENIDQDLIDAELKADPAAAASEWMSEFRQDIQSYVDMETLERCVVPGRVELPPMQQNYFGFVDPSGGSGQDAFAIAIGHHDSESGRAVLDVLRARKPKFSPADVIEEFSGLLKRYHCFKVVGDAFSGEFVAERFAECGIVYERSEATKSVLYANFLGPLNSGQVELLDQPELLAELAGLERRTSRGAGRENIDHAALPGAHDDRANVCAGCVVNVLSSAQGANEWIRVGRAALGLDATTPLDPPPSPLSESGSFDGVRPAVNSAGERRLLARQYMPDLADVTRAGEPTVAAIIPKDISFLTTDVRGSSVVIVIPEGVASIPSRLMESWWLKAQGVRYADEPVEPLHDSAGWSETKP
jgi:hypothetical protein